VKATLPALRASKGKIIITSSGAAVSTYATWGAYGAGKAVLNHLALTLAAEEPDVTAIAIRPGTVDTEMQREIRDVHHRLMNEDDARKFLGLPAAGKLLKPEQPGHVIARLVLNAPRELSGRFIKWVVTCLSSVGKLTSCYLVGTTKTSAPSKSEFVYILWHP
jgi:NAD(P)-dependent dehydrogenase (short-subunit alcohol dehydrogenase family)